MTATEFKKLPECKVMCFVNFFLSLLMPLLNHPMVVSMIVNKKMTAATTITP